MDVRVIIRRSAVFTVIVALITAIYALIAYLITLFFQDFIGSQSILLNGIITAILVAVGFEPLKKRLAAVTDKYLFKAEYNPQEVLSEFSEKMSATLDLDILSQYLTKRLGEVFKTTFVSLFLLEEDKNQYLRTAVFGKPLLNEEVIDQKLFASIFNYLKSIKRDKDIFIREEVKKINEIYKNKNLDKYYETLNKYGINTVVPLYTQDKLVGIIFLGDKKSGDAFSLEDIKMLAIISGQSAVAMQNSSLYTEVNDLNKNLEKKVKEQTQAIVEKNLRLERLLKVKSEFLDIASHQLRTPVSVICGILEMFKSGAMDSLPKEKQMKFIENAFLKGRKLNAVIDDILDASDLDENKLELKNTLTDLDFSELISNIVNYSKMEAEGKKITLKADIGEKINIKGDKKYLEQAVGNIVDNAIKYTSSGKNIEIKLKKEGNMAILSVKDEGIGVPKKEQHSLFKKFSRATNAKEMHTDGSGLGLFIVKNIIEAHPEGKIWFESEEGKGTTFYVQLLTI